MAQTGSVASESLWVMQVWTLDGFVVRCENLYHELPCVLVSSVLASWDCCNIDVCHNLERGLACSVCGLQCSLSSWVGFSSWHYTYGPETESCTLLFLWRAPLLPLSWTSSTCSSTQCFFSTSKRFPKYLVRVSVFYDGASLLSVY